MLSKQVLKNVGEHWRRELQCKQLHADRRSIIISPRRGPEWQRRIFLWQRQPVTVLSLSTPLLNHHGRGLCALSQDMLMDPVVLRRVLGPALGEVEGPTALYYMDLERLPPYSREGVRLLRRDDTATLQALREVAAAEEWAPVQERCKQHVMGQFLDEQLVAIAGYRVIGEQMGEVVVFTHPEYRQHGYGRAVSAAVCRTVLERAMVPQLSIPAVDRGLAKFVGSLGAERYATTLNLTVAVPPRRSVAGSSPAGTSPDSPAVRRSSPARQGPKPFGGAF